MEHLKLDANRTTRSPADAPDGFKRTEIGELPSEWHVAELGEIADLGLGRTPARKNGPYWESDDIHWVAISDLNNGIVTSTKESISHLAHQEVFRARTCLPGTLLLSFKLTIGRVGILGVPAVHNEAIASIEPGEDVVQPFLFYLLQALNYNAYLDDYVKGRTLNKRKLLAIQIPLPPLPEQRAIARVLRTVQEAIEATERVIEAAKELKRSMMEYLFTYGPVPVDQADQVELKETEIGEVPTAWTLRSFSDTVEIERGQVDPTEEPYRSMPNVGPENIERETGELLPLKTAAELGLTSGKYHFTGRDVLYSKIRPYLAKAALPNFEGVCSADMYPLRPTDTDLSRELLFHFLLTRRFTRQAISFQNRTGIPKINRTQLGGIPVPIPPDDEQQLMEESLSAVASFTHVVANRRDSLSAVFDSLLHNLMTGKLRVTPTKENMEGNA